MVVRPSIGIRGSDRAYLQTSLYSAEESSSPDASFDDILRCATGRKSMLESGRGLRCNHYKLSRQDAPSVSYVVATGS